MSLLVRESEARSLLSTQGLGATLVDATDVDRSHADLFAPIIIADELCAAFVVDISC